LRHQQTRARAFFFQKRIGADGGAVAEKRNVLCGGSLIDQLFNAIENGLKRFFRSGRDFRNCDRARFFVEENEIRKCSPGVYGHSILCHSCFVYHQTKGASIRVQR
jgi:hypothetical protein